MALLRPVLRVLMRPVLRAVFCSRYGGGNDAETIATFAATNPKFYGLALSESISGTSQQLASLGMVYNL